MSLSKAPSSQAGGRKDPVQFRPIKTKRGFEEIYDQIRAEIASGRLTPGDRLPAERDLAEMFEVSRQAVREALRGLEITGLIETRLGVSGGAYIRSGDMEVVSRGLADLAHLGALSDGSLLEARIILTSESLRLACRRGTEDDFQRIEDDIATLQGLQDKGRLTTRVKTVANFYRLVAEATHNEVLVLLVSSLMEIVQQRLMELDPAPRPDLVEIRQRTLKFMRAGNEEGAVQEIVEHLKRLEKQLLAEEAGIEAGSTS